MADTNEHIDIFDQPGDNGERLERIVNFSDAVVAIAITLLIIEIHPPELVSGTPTAQYLQELLTLWPQLLSLLITFMVIGTYWSAHHHYFSFVRRYDRHLIRLNLSWLLCIVVLPIPTTILGTSGNETVAVVIYATWMIISSLSLWRIWLYATRDHRLVDADLDPRIIQYNTSRSLIPVSVFALSIAIAFLNPLVAMFSWFLIAPVSWVFRQYMTSRNRKRNGQPVAQQRLPHK